MKDKFTKEKNELISIAKQLGYRKDIIDKMKDTNNIYKCERIMHDAREELISKKLKNY